MPRHEEQKTLAYTADELFSVLADVKDYPSFRHWFWPFTLRISYEPLSRLVLSRRRRAFDRRKPT
jgi:ribosome-associated toxin RatA of RatAB toxin-antitoxin module